MITGDMTYIKIVDQDLIKKHFISVDIRPFIQAWDDGLCYCGEVIIDGHTYNGYFSKSMFRSFGFSLL